jgi:hypothetical protein
VASQHFPVSATAALPPPPAPAHIGKSRPLSSAHPLTLTRGRQSRARRSYEDDVVHPRRVAATDADEDAVVVFTHLAGLG